LGSTLGALILAAYTPSGAVFPASGGYAAAAWAGTAVTALALGISVSLSLRKPRPPATAATGDRPASDPRDGIAARH
jgi:hypothetical protein